MCFVIGLINIAYFLLQSGDTALHYAAYSGYTDAVKMLYRYGGNIYCENNVS